MGFGMTSPCNLLSHQWPVPSPASSHPRLAKQFPPCSASSTWCSAGSNSIERQRNWISSVQEFAISVQRHGVERRRGQFQRSTERSGVRMMAEATKKSSGQATVIISGGPASGKGTQCEMVVEKFGLSHISTGQLLRDEVAIGSERGKTAKEYLDLGNLVPSDIVVAVVEKKLAACSNGWLLDGFPCTLEQAQTLQAIFARPKLFILLDVPDDVLLRRVIGRRMDPATGKVYHLEFSPPENEVIASRLTQRADDTEEKARKRLATYHANVSSVAELYKDIIKRVDGNRSKKEVFEEIAGLLEGLQREENGTSIAKQQLANGVSLPPPQPPIVTKELQREPEQAVISGSSADLLKAAQKKTWIGVPTKLNTTPHSKEIREYFYADVCSATKRAVEDGIHKLRIQITIPELNPEMDVYRIGTLLEVIRELAFTFANDGKRVRVCVQGSMGEGIFSGMPLQLAGTRYMLDNMDWGEHGAKGTFINIGSVGPKEVTPEDDIFILMAPQNAVGNCIIDNLQAMVAAAGDRPVIIVNPRLKDLPASGGVMQVQGREKRLEFVRSFFICYNFRLLYQSGTQYPILGALRMSYPSPYEVYKRVDTQTKSKEAYLLCPDLFEDEPSGSEIADTFYGRPKEKQAITGIWAFLDRILN